MKMKKTIIAVAGLAMAVVLTGCGGSPKGVAEKFADAVIKRDAEKAVKLTLVSRVGSENDIKKFRERSIHRAKRSTTTSWRPRRCAR